jgi:hypothetical protein
MKKVIMTQENLQSIAKEIGGKLWQKNGLCRIYVKGGNNYHYQGKWWFEIFSDGTFEAKCYLDEGFGNQNRRDYVEKHLSEMEDSMKVVIAKQVEAETEVKAETKTEAKTEAKEVKFENWKKQKERQGKVFNQMLEDTISCPPVPIIRNPYCKPRKTHIQSVANLKDTKMGDHYHGCGRGFAYVMNNHVIAFDYGSYYPASNEPLEPFEIYPVDFSCRQICFRVTF